MRLSVPVKPLAHRQPLPILLSTLTLIPISICRLKVAIRANLTTKSGQQELFACIHQIAPRSDPLGRRSGVLRLGRQVGWRNQPIRHVLASPWKLQRRSSAHDSFYLLRSQRTINERGPWQEVPAKGYGSILD